MSICQNIDDESFQGEIDVTGDLWSAIEMSLFSFSDILSYSLFYGWEKRIETEICNWYWLAWKNTYLTIYKYYLLIY